MVHPAIKILVVDDDFFIRAVLSELLGSRNYTTVTAKNGKEALMLYQENPFSFNLIISDLNMPVMDGMELIKILRQENSDIPIIILSGNNEISIALEALNQGANDYIIKNENLQDTIFISMDRIFEKEILRVQNAQLLANLKIKNDELEKFNDTLSKTITDLTKIGTALSSEKDLSKLLEMIVSEACSITQSEVGVLYILEDGELYPKIYRNTFQEIYMGGTSPKKIDLPPIGMDGDNPVTQCFKQKEIIKVSNKYERGKKQNRFLITLPLLDRDNCILGVLKLGKIRTDTEKPFTDFKKREIDIAFSLASQAAVCIENTVNLRRIQRKNRSFQRFVPVEFISFLNREEIEDVELGDNSYEELSVLFSDIRSFTALSESFSPSENFNFLNTFLNAIGPAITSYEGFIDKFIGDATMALFPGKRISVANDAVEAGIVMLRNLRALNGFRKKQNEPPVSIGIGVHCGPVSLGTIGFQERLETTVIGDTVNVASRVEMLTKQYGISFAITSNVLNELKNLSRYQFREVDTVQVKGKKQPITIYEIFNSDPESTKESKIMTLDDYRKAIKLYKSKSFKRALRLFTRVAEELPDDPIIDIYQQRCQHLIHNPPEKSWNGIVVLSEK